MIALSSAGADDRAGVVSDPALPPGRALVQVVALLFGLSILLLGVLGFIPRVTTGWDEMRVAGDESQAQVLGVFQTSVLHNLIHAIAGVVGIVAARKPDNARSFLVGGGIVFVALWLLGIVGGADWIPSDTADNWLHLGLGASMIASGLLFTRGGAVSRRDRQ